MLDLRRTRAVLSGLTPGAAQAFRVADPDLNEIERS
jgi:hypothetical protein